MWKRKLCFALVLVLICAQLLTVAAFADYLPGDTIVYVTDYGEKYHNDGCGALWHSKHSICLYDAVQRGYTRCDRCWPGLLDPNWQPPEPSPAPSPKPSPEPSSSPSPSPKPSPSPSPSTTFDLGELPSITPFDQSKYPSYPVIESKSPSSDTSQKKAEPPTDFEMILAVLGFLLMLGLGAYVLTKKFFERYDKKQEEKESRHRALEQERQEMILRRSREAEEKRLTEQQAIDWQRREEEARRIAEQQAIEQQRRKEEIGRLVELLNIAKQCREEEEKRRKEERRRAYEERREMYVKMYGGVPAEQSAGMPRWFEIGPDGLPKERDSLGWGDWLTYYVTVHGKHVHKKRNCCGASIPIHALMTQRAAPCSKCWKRPPDLRWYKEYLRIKAIKQEYNID